jgi:hypothetical protein
MRAKPKVERAVQYVRGNFFAGEHFAGLSDAQAWAGAWCRDVAGLRVHGTIAARPAEVFAAEEAAALLLNLVPSRISNPSATMPPACPARCTPSLCRAEAGTDTPRAVNS